MCLATRTPGLGCAVRADSLIEKNNGYNNQQTDGSKKHSSPLNMGPGIFAVESGLHAFLIMHKSRSFQLKHSFHLLSSGLGEKMKK